MYVAAKDMALVRQSRWLFSSAVSFLALLVNATELSAQGLTPIPDITVVAPSDRPPARGQRSGQRTDATPKKLDGSAAAGYRVEDAATTGPWGKLPIQDTPYSISVMSDDLIRNVQASAPDQMFRMNPLVQLTQPNSLNASPKINLRGFNIRSSMEDGLRDANGWGNALEQYERVEILSGLSGFLYGPANVGGMVNYVTKRPTWTPLARMTVGSFGEASYYVHGDFGGKIFADGPFAYRLNFVSQNGDQGPEFATQRRNLVSGAIDWRVVDGLTLELNGGYIDYKQNGVPAAWVTARPIRYPAAPPVDRLWSEPWNYQTLGTAKVGANVTWELNDIFTFRASYRHTDYDDANITNTNTLQVNGSYTQISTTRAPRRLMTDAGNAYVDARFNTAFLEHQVTFGVLADRYAWLQAPDGQVNANMPGIFSPVFPIYRPQPISIAGTKPLYKSPVVSNRNIMIGDIVKLNDQLSAMIGVNYARIGSTVWSTPDPRPSSRFDKGAWSPNFSLLFKPVPWITTYGTYIQSLEEGVVVPSTGLTYTNAGQVLPPVLGTQYEIGAKATVGEMFLTAALFQIDKANYYNKNNGNGTFTYFRDGREIHKGLELTATGNLMTGLRLFGGLTIFDATVKKTADQNLVGRKPPNVSEKIIKAYMEYDLPFVPGLTLTGGGYYTGAFYADALNSQVLPGVLIGDLGARYTTSVIGYPVTARLNVTNVANKSYWLNANYLGDPRRVAFSLEATF